MAVDGGMPEPGPGDLHVSCGAWESDTVMATREDVATEPGERHLPEGASAKDAQVDSESTGRAEDDPLPGESTEDFAERMRRQGAEVMRRALHVVPNAVDDEPMSALGFLVATREHPEFTAELGREAAERNAPIILWNCVDQGLSRYLHEAVPGARIVAVPLPSGFDSIWEWVGWQGSLRPNHAAFLQDLERERWKNVISRHAFEHQKLLAEPGERLECDRTTIDRHWSKLEPGALSAPPPPCLFLLCHQDGSGFLPLGKASMLTAEGGAGKTMALMQLAISIVTGRPWLDHFMVEAHVVGRGVVLLLGEEDPRDVHRRMCHISDALGLTDAERRHVEDGVVILPLAGKVCQLLARSGSGALFESPELVDLRRVLREKSPPAGWGLVVLDPLARVAGGDTDRDSADATRFVQAAESLLEVPGNPTVMVAHHSSKAARREGLVDARGVTALTDGFRWCATMRVDKDRVQFRQSKTNHSRPMPDEMLLTRAINGVLRAPAEGDTTARVRTEEEERKEQVERDIQIIMTAMGSAEFSSIDAAVSAAGVRLPRGRAAFRVAMSRKLIVNLGSEKKKRYRVK